MNGKIIKSEKYEIELTGEENYSINSTDNLNYYEKEHFTESGCSTTIALKVYEYGVVISSAIIGADGCGIGIHDDSQILNNSQIIVCCSDSILCLSIPSLDLIWRTQADSFSCFEIFKFNESYIVHGEMSITRLDLDGNIMWQESGVDIFTTENGIDNFEITELYIKAIDWGNRVYKWNFDGEEI